jgi:hypothetical protein
METQSKSICRIFAGTYIGKQRIQKAAEEYIYYVNNIDITYNQSRPIQASVTVRNILSRANSLRLFPSN